MSVKIKNIVIIGMLALVTVPFILLTDLFPFMRFGMFAEPVKEQIQMELFEVSYLDTSNTESTLNPSTIGIEPHFFGYMARNYYYRKESAKFLDNISHITSKDTIIEWRMKRILKGDTTIVSKKIL